MENMQQQENMIIIKKENAEMIAKRLKKANGRARERLASIDDVFDTINILDKKLKGVNKDGILIDINPHAQPFPMEYQGIPMTTEFTLTYKYGTWRLVKAERVPCRTVHVRIMKITQKTKDGIVNKYLYF